MTPLPCKCSSLYLKVFLVVVIGFKLVLMGMFSSDYQEKMFLPFVSCFVTDHQNPYRYFFQSTSVNPFPYPPLMLLIESAFGWIALQVSSFFVRSLIFKLPILLFDCLAFYFLVRMVPKGNMRYICVVYFLSPIILYAGYMHGQLDIIPTAFSVMGVFFLLNKPLYWNYLKSAIFFGLALATKSYVAAILPIVFFYVHKKEDLKTVCVFTVVMMLTWAIFLLPFLCEGLIQGVYFNQEQTKLQAVYLPYGNRRLFLAILVLACIYAQSYVVCHVTKSFLLNTVGITLMLLVLFFPAMPAWFIWYIPFFCVAVVTMKTRDKVIVVNILSCMLFLAYYVFFHTTQYTDLIFLGKNLQGVKISDANLGSITFSLMIAIFATSAFQLYQHRSNSVYSIRLDQAVFIGISGDSGAGKSRMAELISMLLGKQKVLHIEGDGAHRWERGDKNWDCLTALHPDANLLHEQALKLKKLKDGNSIMRRDYDHHTGRFTEYKKLRGNSFIIISGLHSLYLPQTRALMDLSLYLDTDEELRCYWKVHRDTTLRNQNKDRILESIRSRMPDAKRFIYPQQAYADIVFHHFSEESMDRINTAFIIGLDMDFEKLSHVLALRNIRIECTYDEDLMQQKVKFNNWEQLTKITDWGDIANETLPNSNELLCHKSTWASGIDGLNQYMFLAALYTKIYA